MVRLDRHSRRFISIIMNDLTSDFHVVAKCAEFVCKELRSRMNLPALTIALTVEKICQASASAADIADLKQGIVSHHDLLMIEANNQIRHHHPKIRWREDKHNTLRVCILCPSHKGRRGRGEEREKGKTPIKIRACIAFDVSS